ncbi:MAG: DUF502 domain-containing protein [Planctomycetes bacterium]|nr:DUF502 domain-containing protein [Planctomycetota bacterium]
MAHLTRCLIAGIVALLPIGALSLTVFWLESSIRSAFFRDAAFYFPGLGLLAVLVALYAIGLGVTTFVGRWLFAAFDGVIGRVPLLGLMYRSLKQVLGYGKGDDALFTRVVLVPSRDSDGAQLGLVTRAVPSKDGLARELVFVPFSPNPASGRLILVESSALRPAGIEVHQALELLVTMGKSSRVPDGSGS